MALHKIYYLGCFLLSLTVMLGAAIPPGNVNHLMTASCKMKKYKMCYNLEHVCPEFCHNGCTIDCGSCKPICSPVSLPPPAYGSPPFDDKGGKIANCYFQPPAPAAPSTSVPIFPPPPVYPPKLPNTTTPYPSTSNLGPSASTTYNPPSTPTPVTPPSPPILIIDPPMPTLPSAPSPVYYPPDTPPKTPSPPTPNPSSPSPP